MSSRCPTMPLGVRCEGTCALTRPSLNSSCRLKMERAGVYQRGASSRSPMMKPAAVETPLARRFAAALAEAEPGRARIPIDAYTAAFLVAEPALATSPERRVRLAAAIEELIEGGVLKASRDVDRLELPPLPRFVVPLDRVADPPVGREAASYAWRPELAWAARLPLRR